MIKNLSSYNIWKRSTLDRLTNKYRVEFTRIFAEHLTARSKLIEGAFERGSPTIMISFQGLEEQLLKVLNDHQNHVVKAAVSDGIREIDPKTKLSTWEKWPTFYSIEDTFVTLAEKKTRDGIFSNINKAISKKSHAIKRQTARVQIGRYLTNVEGLFKEVANRYYGDESDDTPRDKFKELFQFVFKKTDNQAEVIFRTETTRYFNEARIGYFKNNTEVDFIQLIAVTDGRISSICESRDMYVVPIAKAQDSKFKPPFHPNCRTVQSPLDTDLKSDVDEVRRNLGAEFGKVKSETSEKEFTGRRATPNVPLPKGWN